MGNPETPGPAAVTHKDRPKLPLFVLAAGAVLLGAAALQSVLIVGPGPRGSPHAITVDASRPAATPAPSPTPSPWNPPLPTFEVAPADPDDRLPTGAVPDAPHSADHAIALSRAASPPESASTNEPAADAASKPQPQASTIKLEREPDEPAKPKVEAPAESKPSRKPEPSQAVVSEPEPAPMPKVEAAPSASKPLPQPAPAESAKASGETPAPPAPETKPVVAEPKVEAPLRELKPATQPEPGTKVTATETKPEPVPAVGPKTEIEEVAAKAKPLKPEPGPQTKIAATEAKSESARPKTQPLERPKRTTTAPAQSPARGKATAKPMTLGFRRIAKPSAPASKVSSGRYATSVRAAIGRHRPAAHGGGSATVAFSVGPAGGITGLRIVRSSGKPQLDQAAIATVRSAAPFPPPPTGANPAFSIQIFFR